MHSSFIWIYDGAHLARPPARKRRQPEGGECGGTEDD